MKYKQFITELERGEVASVYLFEGEEDYLKEEALKKLKKSVISPEYEDFNYERLSGANISAGRIIESANTFPLQAKRRLVVVEEIDKLSDEDQRALSRYLDSPAGTTCLVCTAEKLDKRKRLYKTFLEKGKVVSFYPLWEGEVIAWIKGKIEKERKRISPPALLYFKDRVGNDLREVNNEIEKLVLYTHPKQVIEKKDVEEAVGEGKGMGIFDLTKAVREKALSQVLFILSGLLEKGEEPLRIHSLITREMRILLRIKEKEEKISSREACSIIFRPK
ncbi:DNA polymerase III subunit delta, partial [Candidatus Aerophobetes bacterium]|nr:DNA polymerase III subunit delta [Candidatus Aerophobetes bacterium]